MSVQWPLLLFSVLLGTSSGMLVYLGIHEARGRRATASFMIALTALVLLGVGGIASTFHLGHPERALHIMGNMGSGLSRELIGVGVTAVVTLAYAVCVRMSYASAAKGLGFCAIVVGAVLPVIAGSSFMMAARPTWDSATLPLMYLGGGLGLGFTLAAAIACAKGAEAAERAFAAKLALAGAAAAAVTALIWVAWVALAPYPDASRSIMRLAAGDLAALFWIGAVALGVVAPCVLCWMARRADAKRMLAYVSGAFVCLLAGSVALRVIMYAVATSVQQLIY
ncbi:DmsC/YnfH family molybdoenzyme membrane anchor subunit [Adlercreutzia sp. ZJ473]|uniref:dimethyl sulfoxide reductase anchor subunit family protein n=1 Tax=Adlercreutzia sp. ZJ473 TaxID=2722822 RepID=UPI0015554543|nr:DmsC/YnfH family molybdoenzyme membrane anchor subunit [Adlercreutzia sp. ZJ473]